MKVVFTGLPYFSKKIVKELNQFDKKINTYSLILIILKLIN